MAHSYGCMVLSYINNMNSKLINKSIYIDPSCFFTCTTKFGTIVYKKTSWFDIINLIFKLKFSSAISRLLFSEIYHQYILCNTTYFYEYCNRENNLNSSTIIFLSEKDCFVESKYVYGYIKKYYKDVNIELIPNYNHGDFFEINNNQYINKLCKLINI